MISKLCFRQQLVLMRPAQRGLKNAPRFDPENQNKINKLDLAAYLDDLMRRRPQTPGGYINLPQENLKKMISKAQTPQDMTVLIEAQANFIGHRNLIQNKIVDEMLMKALSLSSPSSMFVILEHHKELMYHPSPAVLTAYCDHFLAQPYEELASFYKAIKQNYMLLLPKDFKFNLIDKAYENKDKATTIAAYLDLLSYEGLTLDHLLKVLDSLDYVKAIDHGLIEQLHSQLKVVGENSTSKLHQVLYMFKIKGYLSAADMLKEMSQQSDSVQNSEVIKTQFFDLLFGEEGSKMDFEVSEQIVEAVRGLKGKIDEDYYGLGEHMIVTDELLVEDIAPESGEVEVKQESL